MFQDISLSKDMNDRFRQHVSAGEPLDSEYSCMSIILVVCILLCVVDFTIMVLSSGSWPFSQGPVFSLPIEVVLCIILLSYNVILSYNSCKEAIPDSSHFIPHNIVVEDLAGFIICPK